MNINTLHVELSHRVALLLYFCCEGKIVSYWVKDNQYGYQKQIDRSVDNGIEIKRFWLYNETDIPFNSFGIL